MHSLAGYFQNVETNFICITNIMIFMPVIIIVVSGICVGTL